MKKVFSHSHVWPATRQKKGHAHHLFLPSMAENRRILGKTPRGIKTDGHQNGKSFFFFISEAQSWRERNMTHRCSHKRAPASAHASAHASVHESAHKSWLSLCYNPIQRLPLEWSRECSRGCPRKCTRSGLVVCHLVCFHPLCSLPI